MGKHSEKQNKEGSNPPKMQQGKGKRPRSPSQLSTNSQGKPATKIAAVTQEAGEKTNNNPKSSPPTSSAPTKGYTTAEFDKAKEGGWQKVEKPEKKKKENYVTPSSSKTAEKPSQATSSAHYAGGSREDNRKTEGSKPSYAATAREAVPDWTTYQLRIYGSRTGLAALKFEQWDLIQNKILDQVMNLILEGKSIDDYQILTIKWCKQLQCGIIEGTTCSVANLTVLVNNMDLGFPFRAWTKAERPKPMIRFYVPGQFSSLNEAKILATMGKSYEALKDMTITASAALPKGGKHVYARASEAALDFLAKHHWRIWGPFYELRFEPVKDALQKAVHTPPAIQAAPEKAGKRSNNPVATQSTPAKKSYPDKTPSKQVEPELMETMETDTPRLEITGLAAELDLNMGIDGSLHASLLDDTMTENEVNK